MTSTIVAKGSVNKERGRVVRGLWPRYPVVDARRDYLCMEIVSRPLTRHGVPCGPKNDEGPRSGGHHCLDVSTRRTSVVVVRFTVGMSLKWGHLPTWTADGAQCVEKCPDFHNRHSYLYGGCCILIEDGGVQPDHLREPQVRRTGFFAHWNSSGFLGPELPLQVHQTSLSGNPCT